MDEAQQFGVDCGRDRTLTPLVGRTLSVTPQKHDRLIRCYADQRPIRAPNNTYVALRTSPMPYRGMHPPKTAGYFGLSLAAV